MKTHLTNLLLLILSSSVAVFAAEPVPEPAGTATPPAEAPPQRSPEELE